MNVSATIRPAEPRGGLQSYVTGALFALAARRGITRCASLQDVAARRLLTNVNSVT